MTTPTATASREETLALVFRRHRRKLTAVISRMLRDTAESEDVLHDVFEEFIASYDVAAAIDNAGGWLVRVAQNKIIDRFRRRKTQADYQKTQEDIADDAPAGPGNDWLQESLREAIVVALAALPPEQREVFVLTELEGKKFEEIAAATGVGVNTLLSRKRYAVLALQKHLKEIYDELE